MSEKKKMNVAILSSKKYISIAVTMLTSLLKTNNADINLFVVSLDADMADLKCLDLAPNRMSIHLCLIDKDKFNGITVGEYYNVIGYCRMIAPYSLPSNMERILFLDTDLIIRKDLWDYYNQAFQGKILIGSPSILKNQGAVINEKIKNKFDFDYDLPYINVGVLVMNLKEYRKMYSEQYLLEFVRENNNDLKFMDQDVLNILFGEKTLISDQHLYNFSPKDAASDPKINRDTIKDAYIIHYCGPYKPSRYTYPYIGFEEYWKVAKELNYGEYIKNRILHILHGAYRFLRRVKGR